MWASMGHIASAHDSTAFKSTPLINKCFDHEEFVLADNAYALERHALHHIRSLWLGGLPIRHSIMHYQSHELKLNMPLFF